MKSIREILERVREKKAKLEEKEKISREWRVVSMVFDRIIFGVYVLVNFTGLLTIFIYQMNREPPINKSFEESSVNTTNV